MAYQGTYNSSVQNGYSDNFTEGFPGMIATRDNPQLIDGYPAEEAIFSGLGVVKGTDLALTADKYNNLAAPYTVKNIGAASVEADFVGIAVRLNANKNDANGRPVYETKDMVSVMREGRIFVTANQAISPGDPVYMIIQDTGGHGFEIGSFSNAPLGAGADTVQINRASFWKAAAAGDVAIIELTK